MKNYKEMCADCFCLVAGDNGEWICDEAEKPCEDVVNCPEGVREYHFCMEETRVSYFSVFATNEEDAYDRASMVDDMDWEYKDSNLELIMSYYNSNQKWQERSDDDENSTGI